METVFKNLKIKGILWPLIITLLLSSIFSVAMISPAKAAPFEGDPILYIEPHDNIFSTDTMGINDTFSFDVMIANTSLLMGLQFDVYWDPALLAGVTPSSVGMEEKLYAAHTPEGEEDNIWRLSHVVVADHVRYSYTYMDAARAISGGYAPFNITTAEVAATITVKIVSVPAPGQEVHCDLDITGEILGDPDGNPITHDVVDGYYELSAPPPPPPVLKVDPATYQATHRNETFDINVTVEDLDASMQAVGVEFKLGYDPIMLTLESITEGPFMDSFAGAPHQGTLFMTFEGADYAHVGIVILPDENGTWHEPFPSGNGIIATMTFKVAYGPAVQCNLGLFDTIIADWNTTLITHTTENGTFLFDVETLYHNVIVETQPFVIVTVSNATIMPVPVEIPGPPDPVIHFNATGADGALCFVNITIPKGLIWLEDPINDQWLIWVEGAPPTATTVGENATHTWLYFTFTTSEKPIQVWGTAIIPEFPSPLLLLLALMAASAAAVILTRSRKSKKFAPIQKI